MSPAKYKKLEDHGLIGDLFTCALIGKDGSIDWCCLPDIESPGVFCAILDPEKGGSFRIGPAGEYESKQQYIEMTNILETIFRSETGEVMLTDFMPPNDTEGEITQAIYRDVSCLEGYMDLEVEFAPRFDYGKEKNMNVVKTSNGYMAQGRNLKLFLNFTRETLETAEGALRGKFRLKAGENIWFVLGVDKDIPANTGECEEERVRVREFWHKWVHSCERKKCAFEGKWHDIIVRSSLVLKLLTHRKTGAICAAPTTSIPEVIGGIRNWDYRYFWLRDASFTVRAFFSLGYESEAKHFLDFFMDKFSRYSPEELRTVYGLHGETELSEYELDEFSGYRNSRPVRVGNAAERQFQLDIYGELIQAVYDSLLFGLDIGEKDWPRIKEIVDYVCKNWDEKDQGIWEMRCEPRDFVYSKLMCWVALDRGINICEKMDRPVPDYWADERDNIKDAILTRGFNPKLNSFVQAFDSEYMDASVLLIPIMGLLPYDDPKVQGTIDAVIKRLGHKGLIMRYDSPDGLPGREGSFVLCSLWLVDALAGSGRVEEALFNFNEVLEHTSPLGLLSEEQDPDTGEQLGNFPQAYSHIGLINSAIFLGRAMEKVSEPVPAGKEQK